MADESKNEVEVSETRFEEITRIEDNTAEENNWVSFEEEHEIPLLPQPPRCATDTSSEKYIDRLEQKLCRIKDPSNITSRNIVSALTEARESQMSDLMNETYPTNTPSNQTSNDAYCDEEIRESNCCCLSCYSYLFPKQAHTLQERECLLDEDELSIINSEQLDNNWENHQTNYSWIKT